nr:PREDICTED: uncharacterized protein LOC109032328 [Bemisia tabaci]
MPHVFVSVAFSSRLMIKLKMEKSTIGFIMITLSAFVTCNDDSQVTIRSDQLGIDPSLEVIHLYEKQWPVGIAVSSTGRKFACFPAVLDELNTNNGSNNVYAVAELTGLFGETPYPNEEYNNPSGGAVDNSGPFPKTKGLSSNFLGVISLFIDIFDVLWVLDTGRVVSEGVTLDSSYGGPKLVSIDTNNDSVVDTYVFPTDVARPTSLFGNVRVDPFRRTAYISDSTPTQDNAIIVVDLRTGDSWRTLARDFSVRALPGFVAFVNGYPLYQVVTSPAGTPVGASFLTNGVDGVALSPDFETLYYVAPFGRTLYSVPTSLLRNPNTPATEIVAAVRSLGQIGVSADVTTDSNGVVYLGQNEQNVVQMYDPKTGFLVVVVDDTRINFVARFSLTANGSLYFNVNQFNRLPSIYSGEGPLGVDRRQTPYVLFKVDLPGNATKPDGS